jgi:hypothetical protein
VSGAGSENLNTAREPKFFLEISTTVGNMAKMKRALLYTSQTPFVFFFLDYHTPGLHRILCATLSYSTGANRRRKTEGRSSVYYQAHTHKKRWKKKKID